MIVNKVSIVLGITIPVIVVVALASMRSNTTTTNSGTQPTYIKQPFTQRISNVYLDIHAGGSTYYTLKVPANATDVILNGTYQAYGGLIQRINLYVMDASACSPSDLSNCSTLYLNEQKTLGEVNLALPPGRDYYLLFHNDAVLGEDKQVRPVLHCHTINLFPVN